MLLDCLLISIKRKKNKNKNEKQNGSSPELSRGGKEKKILNNVDHVPDLKMSSFLVKNIKDGVRFWERLNDNLEGCGPYIEECDHGNAHISEERKTKKKGTRY